MSSNDNLRDRVRAIIDSSGRSLRSLSAAAGWGSPTTLYRKIALPVGDKDFRQLTIADAKRVLDLLGKDLTLSVAPSKGRDSSQMLDFTVADAQRVLDAIGLQLVVVVNIDASGVASVASHSE